MRIYETKVYEGIIRHWTGIATMASAWTLVYCRSAIVCCTCRRMPSAAPALRGSLAAIIQRWCFVPVEIALAIPQEDRQLGGGVVSGFISVGKSWTGGCVIEEKTTALGSWFITLQPATSCFNWPTHSAQPRQSVSGIIVAELDDNNSTTGNSGGIELQWTEFYGSVYVLKDD